MGFVRVWWPPVVLGLVIAFLGIGVVEVAGLPAGRAEIAANEPPWPQPDSTSVAPAAIEQYEDAVEAEPPPRARTEPVVRDAPSPTPAERRTPKPTPNPEPRSTPKPAPRPPQVLASAPVPSASPTVPPKPPATPMVRPTPPPVRPADVLDLRPWKLTLPVGKQGHPLELLQPLLGTAGNSAFFRLRPDRGVMFRAPVGGVTTENSSYPRAELREMTPDGRRRAAWSSTSGRHVMTITQAITGTPRAKPHVVAGQIHDAEDDIVMIRLEGRRLFVESDGQDVGLLDPNYRLGTRFTVSIAATSSGIRVTYGRSRVVDVRRAGHGWYFKAGCYVQSNPDRGDRPTAYGEVVIYELAVHHT
jgi:poly(beta-D-mannuronate) lyase